MEDTKSIENNDFGHIDIQINKDNMNIHNHATTGNSKLESPIRSIDSSANVRSILPPINKGNVKGLLQNISHDINPHSQKTEVGDNDLMNQSTIKNFIGKAFNTIDLKPGMIKTETKNQEDSKKP